MTASIEIRITHNGKIYAQKVVAEEEALTRTILSTKERLQQLYDEAIQNIQERMEVNFNESPGSIL